MASPLTDGFSIAALVPEAMLSQVFSRTFLQRLPGMTVDAGQGRTLTVWFTSASLDLAPKPFPLVNPVVAQLGVLARMTGQWDEVVCTIVVRTHVTQVRVGSGDAAFVAPMIDFRTAAPDGFEVGGLNADQTPIWEPVLRAAVVANLAAISPLTAGPLLPEAGGAEYFLTTDPATPYGAGNGVLAVHVWSDGGQPPDPPRSLAPRNVRADRAVALVPRDRVDAAIQAGLAANGLKDLPVDVQDLTITAFRIEWREFGQGGGHFYISGTVDHWSGDVDFEAWVRLIVVNGKVTVNVVRTRADTGFLADVADLFTGGVITRTLEEVLPRAVGGIGGGAFGGLGAFATDALPQQAAFATVSVNGSIDIWPDGLGVPARLVPVDVTSSFPPPTYLRGHEGTREFHTTGCPFGALVKHPRRFPTWQRAVQLGFNGCFTCQNEFNVVAVGRLAVVVSGEGPGGASTQVTARLVRAPKRFGITPRPPQETLSGKFGWHAQEQARHYTSEVLVPGTWEVTAAQGPWSVTTTVDVGKSWTSDGTRHGTKTVVRVAVGAPGAVVEQVPFGS
ncbi:MAG: hypothetical protein U0Q15_15720 [Kineosporiaceae bacterium]